MTEIKNTFNLNQDNKRKFKPLSQLLKIALNKNKKITDTTHTIFLLIQ